jgi:predicted transposase YdaD
MTKVADIGSKRLISLSPTQWVEWVTQTQGVEVRQIISSDFQWISREGDVLVRAYHPEVGEFLLLNEMQLRYKQNMPSRMFAYSALATEKYQLPVYPVLVNILPPTSDTKIFSQYHSLFQGLVNHCDYRVINLWEVKAEVVFEQSISSLLPFVPILKGGGERKMVQKALQQLRTTDKLDELEPLLAFFGTFVLESEIVKQIMRWDMAVLRESPWYQEILKEGEKIGIDLVIKQEIISSIEFGLELKFGSAGLQLLDEISKLDNLDILRQIKNALRSANNLDEIRQIYQSNTLK